MILRILGMLLIFVPASIMILAAILVLCACWNDHGTWVALFVTFALWGCLLLGNWCLYWADKEMPKQEPTTDKERDPTGLAKKYGVPELVSKPGPGSLWLRWRKS